MKPELERTPMPDVTPNESTPLTGDELERLGRMEKAATPAPWFGCNGYGENQDPMHCYYIGADGKRVIHSERDSQDLTANKADFEIAIMARNVLPRLLAELLSLRKSSHSVSQCCPMSERLQKRVDVLEAEIAIWKKVSDHLGVIVAWAHGALSEGQASKALGVDRVAAREMFDEAFNNGMEAAAEASAKGVKNGT